MVDLAQTNVDAEDELDEEEDEEVKLGFKEGTDPSLVALQFLPGSCCRGAGVHAGRVCRWCWEVWLKELFSLCWSECTTAGCNIFAVESGVIGTEGWHFECRARGEKGEGRSSDCGW